MDIAYDAELDLYADRERGVSASLVSVDGDTGAEVVEDELAFVREQYLDNAVSFL